MKSNALPTVVTCPICRARDRLRIYHDTVEGGEWAHCRECGFAGDMIAIAAATWKLGIKPTLRKLARYDEISSALGSVEAAQNYQEDYVEPRRRVNKFWAKCQHTHVEGSTADLRMLQRRFGANEVRDDWVEKAGRFLGSCFKKDADSCFNPQRFKAWADGPSQGTYSSAIFRGPKWNELLAVPFWDFPGRICGFLFIGREARPDSDWVYKGIPSAAHEAGLAMLPALQMGAHKQLGHLKFVFTDVDLALRFHVRHLRDTRRPLPLAASWDNEKFCTQKVWEWFKARHLIFWGTDRLAAIAQAKMAGGNAKVSMLNVTRTELHTNMRNYSPAEWLVRMSKQAVPWAAALRTYLSDLHESEIETALIRLNLMGRDLTDFVKGCDGDLKRRMAFIHEHRTFAARVKFENKWVFEKADGWYLEKGGDRISNAIVRVERVLTTQDKRSYYQGVVKFNGESHPFTEKATTLDRGMLNWMQGFLRDHVKAGVPEFYPSWNRKSFQLAIAFHTPDYAQGIEIIGWDSINRQFNFPKFSICPGGEVTTDFACLFDHDRVPARDVPPPGPFPRRHLDTLSERNDETQIVWATAACVAANILAPAVNRNHVPTLLDGEGAQGIGVQAAERLGCPTAFVQSRNDVPTSVASSRGSHCWPMMVMPSGGMKPGSWIDQEQMQNCILMLSWPTTRVLAMRGRANIIAQHRKLGSMQLTHHAAPYILANYLQDLYRRGIFLPDEHPDLARDVLDDMTDWFARQGGNREAVEAAIRILHTPSTRPARDHFSELVFRLYEDGALTFSRASFEDSKTAKSAIVQVEGDRELVWIAQDPFSDAVRNAGGLLPDVLLVTKSLDEGGILVSEPDYRNERGWLVSGKWWENQLLKWRSA